MPASRVVLALAVTVLAAAIELRGARSGRSLFLVADAVHLLAHVAIFTVLLLPTSRGHDRGEDAAAVAVLLLVGAIAATVVLASARALVAGVDMIPDPAVMLLSLVGLAANGVAAGLLAAPAREWWSFRAALAHELSDASLTVAGLIGAGAIAVLGSAWIDPALSLGIGCWLGWWTCRLLVRRWRWGRSVWADGPASCR